VSTHTPHLSVSACWKGSPRPATLVTAQSTARA